MNSILSRNAARSMFLCGICILMTSLAFALGEDNRNYILIAAMGLSPLILVLTPSITRNDVNIYFIILLSIFCPLLNHPETMRWSTVLYGCMFYFYFIALCHLLAFSNTSQSDIMKLLKCLLFAYAIVLIIQQFCVLLGLPIFNLSNYDIDEPWKLNSLMSEPEHSGRMVSLLMYSYLTVKSIKSGKESFAESWKSEKLLWCAFLWCVLTSLSAGAYLFLFIVLTKFMTYKNFLQIAFILLAVFFAANFVIESVALERFIKFSSAVFTFDLAKIYQTDQSAALRIVPSILCMQQIELSTVDGWFGHGIDYVSTFMSNYIHGVEIGYTGGGLFLNAVEYGFLVFIILLVVTFRLCYDKNNKIPTILFWTFSVLFVGVNSQITWATIAMLYIVKCSKQIRYI